MAKFFRNPLVIGLALLSTIATAFQVAGVTTVLLAKIILACGMWIFVTLEVWLSKWIKKTGRLAPSVILLSAFLSGTAAVTLGVTIAIMKQQQTTILGMTSPTASSVATTATTVPSPAAPASTSPLKSEPRSSVEEVSAIDKLVKLALRRNS